MCAEQTSTEETNYARTGARNSAAGGKRLQAQIRITQQKFWKICNNAQEWFRVCIWVSSAGKIDHKLHVVPPHDKRVYRLENVQSRDHYLAVAHRNNVTTLVAHKLNEPFTLEMMMEQERMLLEEGRIQSNIQHNTTNFSENSGSTFSLHIEWDIHSMGTLTNNVMLVRDYTECYLSFDYDGYPHKNLCSPPRMGNNFDIMFKPIF